MQRPFVIMLASGAAFVVAGCGGTSGSGAASSPAAPSQSAGRAAFRNGTAGELVRITGTTLVLSAAAGDTSVAFTATTPVQKSRTGALADVVVGSCVLATGQKDASGTVVATTVRVSPKTDGTCTLARPGAGAPPSGSPRPSRSPGAPGGPGAGGSFVTGAVQTVAGTAVTVADQAGATQTVSIPTTARVTVLSVVATGALAVGDCVTAQGQKDPSGTVAATSLAITPAGPSGCFTGRGAGGFGSGRGNGGPGGAPGGGRGGNANGNGAGQSSGA